MNSAGSWMRSYARTLKWKNFKESLEDTRYK
jgi:hypothetical protein